MIDNNTVTKVTNRDSGSVGYTIPDLNNLYRKYESGETKEITFEELKKLSYIPGGQFLLENCLIIENPEIRQELLPNVEPEYFYTAEDVTRLLTEGSLDELLDCLDFAPDGVLELVKKLAVTLEISDIKKRNAIREKLNFDVSGAIAINQATLEDREDKSEPKRRVAAAASTQSDPSKAVRRVIKKD